MTSQDPSTEASARLAERLNNMFRAAAAPGITNYAAAEQITASHGIAVSDELLIQLRAGHQADRSHDELTAIADFFSVPADYLIDATTEAPLIDARLRLREALRSRGVQAYHLCQRGATDHGGPSSPEAIDSLAAMINTLPRQEGNPGGISNACL